MIIKQQTLDTPASHPTTSGALERPIKCLILDDSQFDRFRVRRIASRTGLCLDVVDAATIQEFTKFLEAEKFDLMIIDYHLNIGSGLEAIEMVRESVLNAATPLLMISGSDDDTLPATAIDLGCVDYLQKDQLSAAMLENAIQRAVDLGNSAPIRTSDPMDRDSARRLTMSMLRAATATHTEVGQIAEYVRSLQTAATRKDRDKLLQRLPEIEEQCARIQSRLSKIAITRDCQDVNTPE